MDCSYCRKPLQEPKILCCSRLCKSCLQAHIEFTVKDDFIACVICYTKVKIPDPYRPREEWSGQYPTDQFLERMLAAEKQVSAEHNCFVCESSRGAVTPSTQYCFNCDTYYCDGCNELHLQLRGLQGHNIVSIKDLRVKDLMTKRQLYCTKHKDKQLDTYCRPAALKTSSGTRDKSFVLSPKAGLRSLNHTPVCPSPKSMSNGQESPYVPMVEVAQVMCSVCAGENYRGYKIMPVTKAAKELSEKLHKVRGKINAVIEIQEQKSEMLKDRCTKVMTQKETKTDEIESAFKKIQTALDERKELLLDQVNETSEKTGKGIETLSDQACTYLNAMKDVRTLLTWLEDCGNEHDVATSGDIIINQYNHLYALSSSPGNNDLSGLKNTIHIEESIIATFVQLINMIGTEPEGHIITFKTKLMPLRMPEDLDDPIIKDILLLEDGNLVVTDNKNKCVKMAGISDAGDPRIVRLDLKTQPWGVTKLQVNVMAVTGHQCVYIITKTEDLHLQSTVRTRKDYWSVVALSPIKLAVTCKFPPSVDIIDITGRKLRTIENDPQGDPYFKVPQYISTLYDKIMVSDREGKSLTCLDQHGDHLFTFRGSAKQELQQPKGVCATQSGRVFLVENDDVWLLSANGKMINKVMSDVQGVRAIAEENGTLVVSVDGKGVAYYKIIDMSGV